MKNPKNKAIKIILEEFKKKEPNYDYELLNENDEKLDKMFVDKENLEVLKISFKDVDEMQPVEFISYDNMTEMSIYVEGLVRNTDISERYDMLEACNQLNGQIKYMKFLLNENGDVNILCDLPWSIASNDLGETALIMIDKIKAVKKIVFEFFDEVVLAKA